MSPYKNPANIKVNLSDINLLEMITNIFKLIYLIVVRSASEKSPN